MIKQKINVGWNVAKAAIIVSILLTTAITAFAVNILIYLLLFLCVALSVGAMISAANAFTGSSGPAVGRMWSRRKELYPVIISKKAS